MKRALIASIAVNALLTVGLVAWVGWIVVEPRYWFEGAYAERGPAGDKGPRGATGPIGPPGPVGPDAEDAISTVEFSVEELGVGVSDLTDRVDELESDVGDPFAITDMASRLDDLENFQEYICQAVNDGYSGDQAFIDFIDTARFGC